MGKVLFMRKGETHTVPKLGLPSGYTKLEYIESSGTQYVDTGFKPNQNTKAIIDFQLVATSSNYRSILGVRDTESDTSPRQFVFWNYPSDIFRTDYFGTNVTISGLTRLARMVLDKNKNITTVQGTTTTNTAATGQCTQNLFLLGVNEAGTAKYFTDAKLYSCQIYDNGTLVRDFVPCINPSGEIGLYDKVTKAFFGNAGTGTFIAGDVVNVRLPSGYTLLKCIKSTGTQYIDTQVAFSSANYNKIKFSVEMDSANASGAYEVNGTGTSGSNCFYVGNYNGTVVYGHGTNDASTGKTHQTGRCKYTIDSKNRIVSADGMTDVSFTPNSPSGSANLYVCGFGRTNGTVTGFSGKFYAAQIWIDDVFVRDLVPCINPSGEVGMYDLVTNAFFGNAGTGVFEGGADFSDFKWSEIISVCRNGAVPDSWQVGDTKNMSINGSDYAITIIGKNHDAYSDGSGKAPLTLQMYSCYETTYRMHNSNSNANTNNCEMRTVHLPYILSLMPIEVQAAIKEVSKMTHLGGLNNTLISTADKLFLLSEIEVFGSVGSANSGSEGVQYGYYAAGNSKRKTLNGSSVAWWLRSPALNETRFCAVNELGQFGEGDATNSFGVAPAFCF